MMASLASVGCGDGEAPPESGDAVFADVTSESGIDFEHEAGARGGYWLPEGIGSGGAFLDHDGDGDPDLFLVQGGFPEVPNDDWRCRLYRNEGSGHFTDVSEAAGADMPGYGLGAAAADFDADGDVDLYVTRLGPNVLLRNDSGRFADVTRATGVGDPGFGTSAAFLDYDGDGQLDLFVVNYVDWSPEREGACFDPTGIRDYCSPMTYEAPTTDKLYRGRGDGTFEDVTEAAGIAGAAGNGLGVVVTDFDGDGRIDVYVANDQTPAFLWMNRGDGTFVEDATFRGCAFSADGMAIAGMGVVAEDLDDDGDPDLVVTNIRNQAHLGLRNDDGFFEDMSHAWGLADWSFPFTGFGIALFDQDHDGSLDGLIVNGAVNRWTEPYARDNPFAEPNHFLRRDRTGGFFEVSPPPAVVSIPEMSRGLLTADVDADGDLDVVVTNNRGPARMWRNDNGSGFAWSILELGELNARATFHAAERTWTRELRPHAGYLGTSEPIVHAGLGAATRIDSVVVAWPGGKEETWRDLPVNTRLRLEAGTAPRSIGEGN
jgi:hypothetical protein